MIDQNTFMETLESVKEIMRVADTPMTEHDILAYFEDMDLSPEHKQMVLTYLEEAQKEEADSVEDGNPTQEKVEKRNTAKKKPGRTNGEDSKVFRMYLEEIAQLPVYSQKEESVMYERLLQGDADVIHTISNLWLERVLNTAKKYRESKLRIEDLVQEGNMALFLKLQDLCGSRQEVDVRETLEHEIEAGIVAYVSESRGEWEMENAIVGKVSLIHQAKKLLTEETGREPSMEELAEYTKIPLRELSELEDLMRESDDDI